MTLPLGKSASRKKALLFENATAHNRSISGACISPDGSSLVSISNDDTMKLWGIDCSAAANEAVVACESMKKNNHTGRWLSSFRPVFDSKFPRTLIVGSMDKPRRMEVYNIAGRDASKNSNLSFVLNALLMGGELGSVCSRNACHPNLNIVAGGNSSGRVHICR